jgi:hypothetical protein
LSESTAPAYVSRDLQTVSLALKYSKPRLERVGAFAFLEPKMVNSWGKAIRTQQRRKAAGKRG